ncbi:D-alanyl-D-alanine carboxypeptidase [Winogradskyella sp. J14-2]|uniref:M15 family metallopeptidase n=1 Tax=Winogradskyella sp. J14-2 TaxID=1936080 RepID=UPI000972B0AF|nr:M15 family metallopeptidase [Winogradskyella sp. J14-2]APY09492.1 D-alanyl-D-alanine carboxypeptidase [Winogradskyella sp. J14-2]
MIEYFINLKPILHNQMKQLAILLSFIALVTSCIDKPEKTSTALKTKTDIETLPKLQKNKSSKDTLNITKEFVLGKFNYKTDSTFVKVEPKYATKEIYLNHLVYQAFLKMAKAAKKDSIDLKILSGTRNFYEQKAIWQRKWNTFKDLEPLERAKRILEYSSMPSTSRHHWGTDMDLNSLNNSYFNSGKGLKTYQWLLEHAHSFGFYQVYTNKNNGRTGYNEEKWHWSFVPLASNYLEFYNAHIKIEDISEFEGSQLAKNLHVIEDYVNGIANKAKEYKQHTP